MAGTQLSWVAMAEQSRRAAVSRAVLMKAQMTETPRSPTSLLWPGLLLGFALGGFFDGILLHQILQWHHLLSLVDGVRDLRNQVLFDGLFHGLMYAVAIVGLVLLVRGRHMAGREGAVRSLVAHVLAGFGSWHIIDGILSHWVLGIHRIRVDSADPLFWDLIWFVVFGLGPLLAGLLLRRGGNGRSGGRTAVAAMVVLTLVAGGWAARGPADSDTAIVVFRPGLDAGAAMEAIVASGGALLWESRGLWAVRWAEPGQESLLYQRGAVLVSSSFLAGCLAWTET